MKFPKLTVFSDHKTGAGASHENSSGEILRQSPLWMRATTWALMVTAGCGLAWLAFAKTEEVVVATGKLEPSERVQEIQSPVGGVVTQILVVEGQKVKRGDLLMRMDSKTAAKQQSTLEQSVLLKKRQIAFKEKELNDYMELSHNQQTMLARNLSLQQQIENRLAQLQQSGASSELQYLQQKDKVQQVVAQLSESKIEQNRRQAEQAQGLQQLKTELADLSSRLVEVSVNRAYQELRSPVDGLVFDLKPKGVGFVAQVSEPILKIVPLNTLEARVEIPSSDVGFIRAGQSAEISIDSFPATDYGVLEGTVKRIGSDALEPDAATGRRGYAFPALIELNDQKLRLKSGQALPLQIGMTLQANIKLRKVSYLSLLLGSFEDKAKSIRQMNRNPINNEPTNP